MSMTERAGGGLASLPAMFDTKTLAEMLGTTPRHAVDLRAEGKGPPFHRIGRKVRYSRDAVAKWLAENIHS